MSENNNVNNNNINIQLNGFKPAKRIDKWVAFIVCLLLGWAGGHKFYEGKVGLGILYLFTCGLFGIGWFIDLIVILTKSNPYYV